MNQDKQSEVIEPCPFCGKSDAFVERGTLSSCYVICNGCGAKGPESCDETADDVDETGETEPGRKPAIRYWNSRPSPSTPSEGVIERVALAIAEQIALEYGECGSFAATNAARAALEALARLSPLPLVEEKQ